MLSSHVYVVLWVLSALVPQADCAGASLVRITMSHTCIDHRYQRVSSFARNTKGVTILLHLLVVAACCEWVVAQSLADMGADDLENLLGDDFLGESLTPPEPPAGWRMSDRFYGFRFEVHGKVQGVWFRKSTQKKADDLACFGWVQNTERGTVVGEARCNKAAGPKLQHWLESGPELARVDRLHVHVYPDTKIRLHFSDFSILPNERHTCFPDEGPHSCSAARSTAAGGTRDSPHGRAADEL